MELQRRATGIPGLDRILAGGFTIGSTSLLVGEAGIGKTILAHQIGASVVRDGGKVLYLTSLIEGHQSLIQQASTFTFFDPSTISHSFYYAGIQDAIERGGLPEASKEIGRLIALREPTLLILEGLHALQLIAQDAVEYHRFINRLQVQSASAGITTLTILAANTEERSPNPAYTIPDGIIQMTTRTFGLQRLRTLEVRKFRATDFLSGAHFFRITSHGLHIYPRLGTLVQSIPLTGYPEEHGQRQFGISGLDTMMGGGVALSSSTLLLGTPGAGKTLLGLSFLCTGSALGENGLYVGFHEPQKQLTEKAESVGLPFGRFVDNGKIAVQWRPEAELLPDEVAEHLLADVDLRKVTRVVIDGLDDLNYASHPRERLLNFLTALLLALRSRGVSIVMSLELHDILASHDIHIPLQEVSSLLDNIVLLRYVEQRSQVRRQVSILKMRASPYDTSIREFWIGPSGIHVEGPFTSHKHDRHEPLDLPPEAP